MPAQQHLKHKTLSLHL